MNTAVPILYKDCNHWCKNYEAAVGETTASEAGDGLHTDLLSWRRQKRTFHIEGKICPSAEVWKLEILKSGGKYLKNSNLKSKFIKFYFSPPVL